MPSIFLMFSFFESPLLFVFLEVYSYIIQDKNQIQYRGIVKLM